MDPISEILLTSKDDPNKTQLYKSNTLHFHSLSEHTFNGIHYDAELHIVHTKDGLSLFEDNFCVIGILFKCVDDSNITNPDTRKAINVFQPNFPNQALTVNMREIFENTLLKNPIFYNYKGSLTTPPCTETVNWYVHPEVFPVTAEDLKDFSEKWKNNLDFCPKRTGNSRPVCPLNGRTVFRIKANEF